MLYTPSVMDFDAHDANLVLSPDTISAVHTMAKRRRPKSPHDNTSPETLVEEAKPVLEEVRATIGAVLGALPEPVKRGSDLARILDLSAAQAWSIFKVVSATDVLAAGPYVPGGAMMRRLLQAAEAKGVSTALTAKARQAFARFETLVKQHAVDRTTFNSLIRDLDGTDPGKDDLVHKRAVYRGTRHLCGVHAELTLSAFLIRYEPNGEFLEESHISGYSKIQQGRPYTTLLSEHGAVVNPDPLSDPGENRIALRVLEDFCSQPLPEFRAEVSKSGLYHTQVHSRAIGSKGAASYFFASGRRRHVGPTIRGDTHRYISTIVVPCETYVRDLWIHENVFANMPPEAGVYWRRSGFDMRSEMRDSDLLPMQERIIDLGRGTGGVYFPELPRYAEMIRSVADLRGWNPEEFRVFRCRVEYPMLGSSIQLLLRT